MRKILFILVLVLATQLTGSNPCFSQSEPTFSRLYLKSDISWSLGLSSLGNRLGLVGELREKWSIGTSFRQIPFRAKNTPNDWNDGSGTIILIGDNEPSVNLTTVDFTAGKFFQLDRKNWFNAMAGPSLVFEQVASFTRKAPTPASPANYRMTKTDKAGAGINVEANIDHAISRFLAIGLGVAGSLNSVRSIYTFEFHLVIGKLGIKRKE